jgi:hypothetical protein
LITRDLDHPVLAVDEAHRGRSRLEDLGELSVSELEVLPELLALGDVLADAEVRRQGCFFGRQRHDVEKQGLGSASDHEVFLREAALGRDRSLHTGRKSWIERGDLPVAGGEQPVPVELEEVEGRLVEVEETAVRVEHEDRVQGLSDQCPVLFFARREGLLRAAANVDPVLSIDSEQAHEHEDQKPLPKLVGVDDEELGGEGVLREEDDVQGALDRPEQGPDDEADPDVGVVEEGGDPSPSHQDGGLDIEPEPEPFRHPASPPKTETPTSQRLRLVGLINPILKNKVRLRIGICQWQIHSG